MAKIQPVRQLDYESGEKIFDYDSIAEAAEDNYLDRDELSKALRLFDGYIHKRELRFMYINKENEKEKKHIDGLIVKQQWADLIVDGVKTMEVRGRQSLRVNERIAIVVSGTNLIIGYVTLVQGIELTKEMFESRRNEHMIDLSYDEMRIRYGYKKLYGWVMEDAVRLEKPIICENRKQGQVIWIVNAIEEETK